MLRLLSCEVPLSTGVGKGDAEEACEASGVLDERTLECAAHTGPCSRTTSLPEREASAAASAAATALPRLGEVSRTGGGS